MQKNFILLSLSFLLVLLIQAGGLASESIVGVWKTIDDETNKVKSHVQIVEKNGKFYGKVVKLLKDPPDKLCTKCEGEKKNKPVVGMEIVWNMSLDDDEYQGGKIMDPKNGKTYTCKMWLEDKNKLKVRGYVAFFYRTQYWFRLDAK